jgi:hypothetical protein
LRLQVLLIDLRLTQGVLQHQRIDFRQPLALLHLVADLDLERLQLPRHLGADIHLLDAFQQTGGEHGVFDIRAFDRRGLVLRRFGRCLHRVQHQPGHRRQRQPHTDFAQLRLFHK